MALSEEAFKNAANKLNCEINAIKAVAEVEATGKAFLSPGKPVILFESKQFSRLTGGRYDKTHPSLSTSSWVRNYGPAGKHQWDRLEQAKRLDEIAALSAASWGLFQIMGFNFKAAGFNSVKSFVDSMCESEENHLDAFVNFILANRNLTEAIQNKEWTRFARTYNGPGYAQNAYDKKLSNAYNKFVRLSPKG